VRPSDIWGNLNRRMVLVTRTFDSGCDHPDHCDDRDPKPSAITAGVERISRSGKHAESEYGQVSYSSTNGNYGTRAISSRQGCWMSATTTRILTVTRSTITLSGGNLNSLTPSRMACHVATSRYDYYSGPDFVVRYPMFWRAGHLRIDRISGSVTSKPKGEFGSPVLFLRFLPPNVQHTESNWSQKMEKSRNRTNGNLGSEVRDCRLDRFRFQSRI
jgi:hypothetical protein